MYKKRTATPTVVQGNVITLPPTVIDQSGLFAYDSSGDLVPVSTVSTASDTLFELDANTDIQPQA
jgi:hypothetical protein